jgi:hypothetical protein
MPLPAGGTAELANPNGELGEKGCDPPPGAAFAPGDSVCEPGSVSATPVQSGAGSGVDAVAAGAEGARVSDTARGGVPSRRIGVDGESEGDSGSGVVAGAGSATAWGGTVGPPTNRPAPRSDVAASGAAVTSSDSPALARGATTWEVVFTTGASACCAVSSTGATVCSTVVVTSAIVCPVV